jgi:hypothetical protein
MKIRPVAAELFSADRQTDRQDEANSWFWKFCERSQKRLGNTDLDYVASYKPHAARAVRI